MKVQFFSDLKVPMIPGLLFSDPILPTLSLTHTFLMPEELLMFLNTRNTLLPQGLCICYFLLLECSSLVNHRTCFLTFKVCLLSISMLTFPMTNPSENTASSPYIPASFYTPYSTFMFHFPPKFLPITNLFFM